MLIDEQPIRFGTGHCCACASTCNHIGPIRLCAMHERMESRPAPDQPEPCEFCNDEGVVTTDTRWGEVTDDCLACHPTPDQPEGAK